MSFIVYGDDNTKSVIAAGDIEEAYKIFISKTKKYFIDNYNYKIERYYKWLIRKN